MGKIICPKCKGEGWYREPYDSPTTKIYCNMCERKGEIILLEGSEVCNRCNGQGMLWTPSRLGWSGSGCDKCSGKGIIKSDELKKY
jgi:DnaJ-class molecular chaperone